MAITKCEITGGNCLLDENIITSASIEFRVDFDEQSEDPIGVRSAFMAYVGIGIGDPYVYGDTVGYCNVKSISAVLIDNGLAANCTVEYGRFDPTSVAWENPLDKKPVVTIDGNEQELPADFDVDGQAIINSAFDPYDPTPAVMAPNCIMRITKNYASFTPHDVLNLSNRTNEEEWFGFPAETVRILPIKRPAPEFDQNTQMKFYPVTYEFAFNPLTWKIRVLNAGYREIDPAIVTGDPRKNILVKGVPATDPQLLDADGAALIPPIADADIVWKEYRVYQTLNFTDTFAFDSDLFD